MRLVTRSDFDGLACGALLLEAGIIVEAGRANSGNQGRRSMVVDINEHAFYCFGMEPSG